MYQGGVDSISIFAGLSGKNFAQRMCNYLNIPLGDSTTIHFSDGNTFVRVNDSIRSQDVFLVQPLGFNPNQEFVELLFWIDAFKRASANSVTVIMPYFSYAKGDKKDEPRVSIRARVCAETIELAGADRIVTMELHSPQVQGFFKIPLDHLNANRLFYHYFTYHGMLDSPDWVVVSPDTGFAKQARGFADQFRVPVAIGDKMRVGHDENAQVMNIIGDVAGKKCMVIDDFSASGGTLADVARALKDRGADEIHVAVTHCLLKEEGVRRVEESPIESFVCTDTVDCPAIEGNARFRVISAAPLFAESVRCVHERSSLGILFEHLPQRLLEESFAMQTRLF
jgi:ribose-phosphate pyrophosphokinase